MSMSSSEFSVLEAHPVKTAMPVMRMSFTEALSRYGPTSARWIGYARLRPHARAKRGRLIR